MKIGKSAVLLFEQDIERFLELKKKIYSGKKEDFKGAHHLYIGEIEKSDDAGWKKYIEEFFEKV